MLFFLDNLQFYQMSVSLQRVFHSIRFKVNLKSASNLNGNLNCSKELEHYAS